MKPISFALVAATLVIAGCVNRPLTPETTNTPPPGTKSDESNSVRVGTDAIAVNSGKDNLVKISFVELATAGFVEIHQASNGNPGAIIGTSEYLNAGRTENFEVRTSAKMITADSYYAMLHSDDGDKTFTAATDKPVKNSAGDIIMMIFTAGGESESNDSSASAAVIAPVTITMTAKKWEFIPSEVRVKAGQKVTLRITSTDVKHGIASPALGISADLQPNQTTDVVFTAPTETGSYDFFCSVFCGAGHADMQGTVIVE